MLIDLISTSNYVSFNIKLAHIIGLNESIYLSELMNINDKAIRKKKIDNNYFKLDRKYIQSRTTFDISEQNRIEKNLIKLEILKSEDNNIALDINKLIALISSEEIAKSDKPIPKTKTSSKIVGMTNNLKRSLKCTNVELFEAFSKWIESVLEKQGWMSKVAVEEGEKLVDNFSNHDLDIALTIINIAAINGYRDMNWAIQRYKENYNVYFNNNKNMKKDNSKIELSDEVF